MGSAISWFIGSLLFFILVISFTGAMGIEIAEADIGSGSVSSSISTNASQDFDSSSPREAIGFVGGLGIAWGESPLIVTPLLLIPVIIIVLSGYLIVVRGSN